MFNQDVLSNLYPGVWKDLEGRKWITVQANRMLAKNTVDAYARSLEDFLQFAGDHGFTAATANREQIAGYANDLCTRKNPRVRKLVHLDDAGGLTNATVQLRLTVVRLFFDDLVTEGVRSNNPVGRSCRSRRSLGEDREGPLIRRRHRLPWIPNEEQWEAIIRATKREPLRNRLMFALAYDAALRRGELVGLETANIDPAHRLLRVSAERTKNCRERIVPYSDSTATLYSAYLQHRRSLSRDRGPLFLSESNRNANKPLTIWMWSKVVERIGASSGVPSLTTHTLRHLCLTDLARAGWDIHEIASFAGHQSVASTLLYIHLSGRDLSKRLAEGMSQIHAWRVGQLGEAIQ